MIAGAFKLDAAQDLERISALESVAKQRGLPFLKPRA